MSSHTDRAGLDPQQARALAMMLFGDMSADAFNSTVREQQSCRFTSALPETALATLFDFTAFDELLADAAVGPHVDVFKANRLVRLSDMQHRNSRTAHQIAAEELREGASVRIRDAHQFDASLGAIGQALGELLCARCEINLYLTPPGAAGFPPHFDITDVFVIQMAGSKEWMLQADYANETPLPLPHTEWDPERFVPGAPGRKLTLKPGDVLYLPRGKMHSAACLDEESLHLTIALEQPTYFDLAERMLRQLADQNVALRQRLPLNAEGIDDEVVQAQLAACLSDMSASWRDVCASALAEVAPSAENAGGQDSRIMDVFESMRADQKQNSYTDRSSTD